MIIKTKTTRALAVPAQPKAGLANAAPCNTYACCVMCMHCAGYSVDVNYTSSARKPHNVSAACRDCGAGTMWIFRTGYTAPVLCAVCTKAGVDCTDMLFRFRFAWPEGEQLVQVRCRTCNWVPPL